VSSCAGLTPYDICLASFSLPPIRRRLPPGFPPQNTLSSDLFGLCFGRDTPSPPPITDVLLRESAGRRSGQFSLSGSLYTLSYPVCPTLNSRFLSTAFSFLSQAAEAISLLCCDGQAAGLQSRLVNGGLLFPPQFWTFRPLHRNSFWLDRLMSRYVPQDLRFLLLFASVFPFFLVQFKLPSSRSSASPRDPRARLKRKPVTMFAAAESSVPSLQSPFFVPVFQFFLPLEIQPSLRSYLKAAFLLPHPNAIAESLSFSSYSRRTCWGIQCPVTAFRPCLGFR